MVSSHSNTKPAFNWILLCNSLYFLKLNVSLVFCRHFLLCLYGAVAIGFILAGRVKELRIVHILTSKYHTRPLSSTSILKLLISEAV